VDDDAVPPFIPAGPEFRVNTTTPNRQQDAAVAADQFGNFVVVWASDDGVVDGWNVRARRYTADGAPAGAEFVVSATTFGHQSAPAVAMDHDGDFVVAWQAIGQPDDLLGGHRVYARRYDAAGQPKDAQEFPVSTAFAVHRLAPSVSMESDGDFVVAWLSSAAGVTGDIVARRFGANGSPLGDGFQVSSGTGGKAAPAVASDNGGNFMVTWRDTAATPDRVYARLYDAAGAAQGGEFPVGDMSPNANADDGPSVSSDGSFVIAWTGTDADGTGILARRYNWAGQAHGPAFVVNSITPGNQQQPAVAVDNLSGFYVTWYDPGQNGADVFVRA